MRSQRLASDAVMGDEQQRGASALLQREQEVHDLRAGGEVEIAGRLVGEDQRGPRPKRAGDRHALLLAAGELAGEMRLAMRQPDLGERRARRIEGVVPVEEFERQRHVLERGHGRHEVEGLEHDADIGGTEPGQAVLIERGIVGADHLDAAAGRASSPAMTMSSVDLPEPRGPTTAMRVAGRAPRGRCRAESPPAPRARAG